MRILFYNPAPTQKRFVPFEAIKGSAFFRRPNYDAMRLSFLSREHDFYYYDERIEEKPDFIPDILVVNVPLHLSHYIQNTIRKRWGKKTRIICYGFYTTLFPKSNKKFADIIVIGDIANVWKKILSDAETNNYAKVYKSNSLAQFNVDRRIEEKYGFTPALSQLRTSFGCACINTQKDFCYENILYKNLAQCEIDRVVEEISRIKRKIIFIRDDDFLYDIDYTVTLIEKCWRLKKMWIFQTSSQIFNQDSILPVLRDNGTRIIWLKEDWLGKDLQNNIDDKNYLKEKKHQVSLIHKYRIAVGCKLRQGFEGEDFDFYRKLLKFLIKIKVDLIKITVQTPIPQTVIYKDYMKRGQIIKDLTLYDQWMPVVSIPGTTPQALYSWMEWLRDSFYSWDSILHRNILVSPKLGLYNTILFYIIPNLSYRNNFLEKVGYPP